MRSSIKKNYQWLTLAVLIIFSSFLILDGCTKKEKRTTIPGEEWAEELRVRVERHIDDPGKKRVLMELVDQDVNLLKELSQQIKLYNNQLVAVDRNYNSTLEDFKKVFTEFNETRYRMRSDALDIRLKMKDLCSPEEWKGLSRIRTKDSLFKQMFPNPSIE
ncbi:MAG: hypothetical protein JRE14_08195 [Deltaproteobacteria bacterium]|nr:hypothetical protein [Deltaproteobacteria bacterium]